jgi:hypothetical protein
MPLPRNERSGSTCMKLNIFTYLSGYDRAELYERFAGSLFDTGFDGTLYLFVHEKDYPCLSLLPQELQDKIYFVTCPEQMDNQQDDLNDDTVEHNEQTIHPQNFRYLLYLSFLQQNKQKKNEYSFFCDAKDVLFQRNPEEYIIDDDVDMLVFEEDTLIKDCIWNMSFFNMVKSSIPDGKFDYESKKAICSGTTLVKNSALYYFIYNFCEYMMQYNLNSKDYMDQGLHNYMIYNNTYGCNVKIVDNKNELVYTAGHDKDNVKLDNNHQILNADNKVPHMVHQYDRLDQSLLDQISSKYEFNV